MTAKTLNKLPVPGATLHYEVTGSGPMLLLIPDGDSDSAAFDTITGKLAAQYTVTTYDPRGNARSHTTPPTSHHPTSPRYTADPPSTQPNDEPASVPPATRHTGEPAPALPATGYAGAPPSTRPDGEPAPALPATGYASAPPSIRPDGEPAPVPPTTRYTGNPPSAPPNDEPASFPPATRYAGDPVAVSTLDALALIDLISPTAPAFVFGTGAGAITGLDLITHHPDRVRLLVAHEPPCIDLLPDAADARAFFEDVHDTYRREGVAMAQLLYAGGTGLDEDDLPAPEDLRPEYREFLDRTTANAETYFAGKLLAFINYHPDLTALATHATKIVPAAGRQAANHLPARPIAILATHLGWPVVTFPGAHPGYASHPTPFATLLAQVLEAELT
ncbi:alpha/beta fold hydrolase [Kribbella catacumbae]|uniref:alpha/beta fold hydrolase n=1 Tax=Kribbella catacumbae TaxID=460086 RepID=UPI000382E65F|nr:hypothetical protein [Kribbella catacumbae]